MGRFQFRLQALYDLRRHMEKEQKDALAREKQRLDALRAEAERLSDQFSCWSRKYLVCGEQGMSPAQAAQISGYLSELERLIRENARQTVRQEAEMEKARQALVEKMKDRKVMDTLHDKQQASFQAQERLKDEKEIEEIISNRL